MVEAVKLSHTSRHYQYRSDSDDSDNNEEEDDSDYDSNYDYDHSHDVEEDDYDQQTARDQERFRERRSYVPTQRNDIDHDNQGHRFQQVPVVSKDNRPCAKKKDGCIEAELHTNLPGLMSKDENVKKNAELQDLTDDIAQTRSSLRVQSKWVTEVSRVLRNYEKKVKVARKRLEGYQADLDALEAKKEKIIGIKKRKKIEKDLASSARDLQEIRSERDQIKETEKVFSKEQKDTQDDIQKITHLIEELEGVSDADGTGSDSTGDDGDDDGGSTGSSAPPTAATPAPATPPAPAPATPATPAPGGFFFL